MNHTYTKLWQTAAGVCTVAGVGAALVTAPTSAVVTRCVLGATLTGLATFAYYTRAGATPPPRALLVRVCGIHAAFGAAGVVAATGIGAISAGLLGWLLVGLGATAPVTVGFYRRHTTPHHGPDHDAPNRPTDAAADDQITPIRPAPPPAPPPAAAPMSDEELCRAWRASFTALHAAATCAAVARVAAQRQGYLDEFERRNPHGLSAWLESGARAAGNPQKYLVNGRADRTDRHPEDQRAEDQRAEDQRAEDQRAEDQRAEDQRAEDQRAEGHWEDRRDDLPPAA